MSPPWFVTDDDSKDSSIQLYCHLKCLQISNSYAERLDVKITALPPIDTPINIAASAGYEPRRSPGEPYNT
jgi:hypothetical protein